MKLRAAAHCIFFIFVASLKKAGLSLWNCPFSIRLKVKTIHRLLIERRLLFTQNARICTTIGIVSGLNYYFAKVVIAKSPTRPEIQ